MRLLKHKDSITMLIDKEKGEEYGRKIRVWLYAIANE